MLVRNLKTKSDYEKSILSQEENLRLAIKNDQQISDARKKARTGILPEPTQKMTRNTEQILTDRIDIQNKALQNLLSIYEPTKANEFLNGKGKVLPLTPEQLEYLNIFWEDIKKELLTKTGLTLAFFRRILKQSYAGRRSNYGFSTTRSGQTKVINTPEELSRIVPRVKYIDLAIQTAKPIAVARPELEPTVKEVVKELAILKKLVPVPGDFQKLTRLPPPKQAEYYQRFQEVFDGLATEEEEWDKVMGLDDESFLKIVRTLYPDSLDFKQQGTKLYKDLRAEPDAVVDVVVDEGLAAAEIEAEEPEPAAPEPEPVAQPAEEPVAPKLPESEEPEPEPLERFVEFEGDDLEGRLEQEVQRLEFELSGYSGELNLKTRRAQRALQDELNRVRYEQTIYYDKRLDELQEQRKEIIKQYKATEKKPVFIGVNRQAELDQIQQQAFDIDQRMAGISAFLKERLPLLDTRDYTKTRLDSRAIRLRRKEKVEAKKELRDEALADEYTKYALESAKGELELEKKAEEFQVVRRKLLADRRAARLALQQQREQEERDLRDTIQYKAQLAYMANPPTPVRQLLSQESFSAIPTDVARLNPEVAAIRRQDMRRQQQYLSALQSVNEGPPDSPSPSRQLFNQGDFGRPLAEPKSPPLRASPAKPSGRPATIQEVPLLPRPPPPKRRTTSVPRKSGKGVAVKQDTWAQLGKFIISEKKLSEGALQVKYERGSPIPGYSRIMAISDTLQAILQDLLDTGRLRGVSELDSEERNRLETLLIKSGIGKGLGIKETTPINEDAEKVKRFGIVRGIYDAGNNSTEVIHELRSLILYFVKTGRLDKRAGMEALQELQ